MKKPLASFNRKLTDKEISKNIILLDSGTGLKLYDDCYINCEVEINCNSKHYQGEIKFDRVIQNVAFIDITIQKSLGNINTDEIEKRCNDIFKENAISVGDSIEIDVIAVDTTNKKLVINILKVNL